MSGWGHSYLHTLEIYPPEGKILFKMDIKFFHYFFVSKAGIEIDT